ncbi:MAG: M15 family metallopeptidase [Patescibacteria group bacterium]
MIPLQSMDKIKKLSRIQLITGAFIVILAIIIGMIVYGSIRFYLLSKKINTLSMQVSSLENRFASSTDKLNENMIKTNTLYDTFRQNMVDIEHKIGTYRQEVGSYTSTVDTLQKLSKIDPQLLAKYSKVFFLNENYAPARLIEIPSEYYYSNLKVLKLYTQVWPYLQRMLDEANKADMNIYIQSAYRSFNEQKAIKGQNSVIYGAGSANSFSADQGYSEHQLGTTVDLITKGLGGNLEGFDKTKAYDWLLGNAYRFGFILSYPKDNKFYVFEPWHWRFVGVKLATELHNQNRNFYDMDQRVIDDYLAFFFD